MENIQQERHSWLKLSIILFFFLLMALASVGLGDDTKMPFDLTDAKFINLLKVLQAVSVIIIFILPAILFALFWTKPKLHYLGILKKPAITTLVIAGVGMLLAMPMINWLAEMNQNMKLPDAFSGLEHWMKASEDKAAELTEAFTKGTSVGVLIVNLIVIALMAAVSEELFFRGIVQKVLIECVKNKHVGVWIGAILFSAFHMQFYGFIPRMLMGAYLGYLFLWSGSIYPGMFAHFLNNGLAVFFVWLANRGAIAEDADKIGSEGNEWVYVLISVVLVVISLFAVYRVEMKRRKKLNLENICPTIQQ